MAINKAEAAAAAVVVAIGVTLFVHAYRLDYMVENVPGPGFLPLWLAVGIVAAGLVLAAKALRPALASAERIDWPQRYGWTRIAIMLGALAVALFVLEPLGFLVTATLFMSAVVFALGVRSWPMLLGVPVLAALVLHLVFVVWLDVPLPAGLLAFGE